MDDQSRLRRLLASSCLALALIATDVRGQTRPIQAQILWQRSLEDALALSRAEHRPILIAVNMDGESACERIVRERYRDPAFVALTRPFVCVIASVFRHTPRDHDDAGRRIACPRLGEITCGEHMLLEPVLYERFLQGERIAPRHALILESGEKVFDLFQLFDLRELDQKLAGAASLPAQAPMAPSSETIARTRGPRRVYEDFLELAQARDHRGRLALENALLELREAGDGELALRAIADAGNPQPAEALRSLLQHEALGAEITRTALDLGAGPALAALIREQLGSAGPFPGAPALDRDTRLLSTLARLDRDSMASRSLVLAVCALGGEEDRSQALDALSWFLDRDVLARAGEALEQAGGAFDIGAELFAIRSAAPPAQVAVVAPEPASIEALERELDEIARSLAKNSKDPLLFERFGKTSLELAKRRIELNLPGAELLLQDALKWLGDAQRARPGNAALALDLAHTNYLAAHFDEEERWALEAWKILGSNAQPIDDVPDVPSPARAELQHAPNEASTPSDRAGVFGPATPAAAPINLRLEACRWLGDACARRLSERSGKDPALEIAGIARGARALGRAVFDAQANETDWISLASFFGALGLRRAELACLQEGSARLFESNALRQALNGALWNTGRIDLAPCKAEWIAALHPRSGACAWHAGYAHLLAAENARREEAPERAIESYRSAERALRQSSELDASSTDSAGHFIALAALGRGFAHLLADRQQEAADALVESIALRPAIVTARDGLDREAIDLLDGALEYRAQRASPVDATTLLFKLEEADPGDAFWAHSIADSELREALRADGRSAPQEGDRYMLSSIEIARHALEHRRVAGEIKPSSFANERALGFGPSPENRRTLAQSLTVHAERLLQRNDVEHATALLLEAAPQIEVAVPADVAGDAAVREFAAAIRSRLGEARPQFRPGR